MSPALSGVLLALAAVTLWGLFPIYWKQLTHVDPLEVLAHRALWSVPFTAALVWLGGNRETLVAILRASRRIGVLALTAGLISINWGVYIWAMGQDKVVEASMGYFLSPLISVALGVMVFGERLGPFRSVAIAVAASGVLYLFAARGAPPWIALVLGLSFACYGALRKRAAPDPISGMLVETALLAPVALAYLALSPEPSAFLAGSVTTDLLLAGAGAVTALPLMLFVAAAGRLHYATVGLLFYLTPTIQFVIGIWYYREPLTAADLVAFGAIWTALAIFAITGVVEARRRRPH